MHICSFSKCECVCLFVCLFFFLFAFLFVCCFVCMSVCLFVCLFVCLNFWGVLCVFGYLFFNCLSISQIFVCLFAWLFVYWFCCLFALICTIFCVFDAVIVNVFLSKIAHFFVSFSGLKSMRIGKILHVFRNAVFCLFVCLFVGLCVWPFC